MATLIAARAGVGAMAPRPRGKSVGLIFSWRDAGRPVEALAFPSSVRAEADCWAKVIAACILHDEVRGSLFAYRRPAFTPHIVNE